MGIHTFLSADEPAADPDSTERITPLYAEQGDKVVTLEGPDKQQHVVRVGSLVHKLMIEHKYRVVKNG